MEKRTAGVVLMTLLCGAPSSLRAQQKIDVSEEYQRLADPSVHEGYGISCGISGIEGYRPKPLPLELSVVSLSPTDLMDGDKITFEVAIKNIGKETVAIPWSVIPTRQLRLCPVEHRLWVTFTAPSSSSQIPQMVASATLYGLPFDQSLLPLHPGDTASIRADWQVRMDDPSQEIRDVEVTPALVLFHGGLATERVVSQNVKVRVRARPRSSDDPLTR